MKNVTKLFSLAVVVLALGACAGNQCTDYNDYDRAPYYSEGTAGSGVAVYGAECASESKVMKAEPIMQKKARK